MAAPAELRNAQHAPSDEIAPRECGWKHGDSGYSVGKELCQRKEPRTHYESRIPLTPTGFSWKALTLKFRVLSIRVTFDAFETVRNMSVMRILQQLAFP